MPRTIVPIGMVPRSNAPPNRNSTRNWLWDDYKLREDVGRSCRSSRIALIVVGLPFPGRQMFVPASLGRPRKLENR